jgi:dTDP-4-amino-4,6-dideoxygalactose transaminase
MRTRIETRRFILRPFEPADVEVAFGWFGDPVVMRFTVTGLPAPPAKFHHVFNQFIIRRRFRDELRESLRQAGLPGEIYHPLCLHLQPAFAYLSHPIGDLSVAETASKEVLSLPVFPELSSTQQDLVVKAIADFCAAKDAA